MEKTLIVKFLLLFAIFNDYVQAKNDCIDGKATINITVDNTTGNDSSDCFNNDGANACKTLDYALSNISHLDCRNKSLFILISNGTYNYSLNASNTTQQFWSYWSISIVGKGKDVSIIYCNKSDAGFAFFYSSKVTVQDVSIEHCGSHQNGTSYNSVAAATYKVSAALYFAFCRSVSIIRSVISQSADIGVVMYNTNETLNVINSTFSHNHNKSDHGGGGGFYAEFTYCNPGFTENCTQHSYSYANYTFEGSEFSCNAATDGLEKNNTFIRANGTTNIAFGRGGGLSLIFKGDVSKSNVIISKCNISFNKATWGAGLFIEFQDKSNHNKVLVKDTTLSNNECELAFKQNYGTGGGGARIGFISFKPFGNVHNNTITFESCTFTNNEAYWGGGISYYTFREPDTVNATNYLSFNSCLWIKNRAVLGSAIDLSVWHSMKQGVLSSVVFYECNFTENTNKPASDSTYYKESYLGTGAFYSDSIPVTFQKFVNFHDNKGSAMALSATSATFHWGCNSTFSRNFGWTGGAIALLGNAWLEIHNLTYFSFYKNSAVLNGGAISVMISSRHDLLSSRNCFLQYHNQFIYPDNWSTDFDFTGNTVIDGHGHSIFATSLLSCVWGNSEGKLINGTSIKPFHNWTIFHFDGKADEISTEIANINININPEEHNNFIYNNATGLLELHAAPGQPVKLPLIFEDDAHNAVSSSIYLLPSENNDVSVANKLTADRTVTMLGREYSTAILQVVTDSPRIVSINISVKLVCCPPGYFWDSSSNAISDGACKCGNGDNKNISWDGILYCDDDKFCAKIEKDYWAGNLSKFNVSDKNCTKQHVYTGKCPKNYCSTSGITLLPFSAQNLTKDICENQNRTGRLCGECLNGSFCVAINSRYYACTRNVDNHKWLIWLATEYLPSTILLVTILFYDINLHSGSMGAVVMYFQVYSALNIYSDGEISPPEHTYAINKAINFLYNIWNLEYIGMWLHPYCVAKNLNTMQVLMISYLSGFYPFLLIFIYFLFGTFKRFSCCNPVINFCIRLRWRTSLKASIINGLSTFWTLAYTKLALVSCLILTIGYLQGRKDASSIKYVVFLQGNIDYFHQGHLPYAIPALIILVVFVILPSLALLCYPLTTRIMAKVKEFINLDGNRFYAYISTKMERPFIRFKPLLDSFQGPYKQGCEFFAGLVYWYRLGIFFTYSFASGSTPFYINSVISVIFVTLISIFQPFKNAKNNTVMLLITINITLINLISLYNYYEDISDFMSWFQLLLIILPFVYFTGCAVCGFIKKIKDYVRCAPPAGLYTNIQSQEFDDSLLHDMAEE